MNQLTTKSEIVFEQNLNFLYEKWTIVKTTRKMQFETFQLIVLLWTVSSTNKIKGEFKKSSNFISVRLKMTKCKKSRTFGNFDFVQAKVNLLKKKSLPPA